MQMTERKYGVLSDGTKVRIYTVTNGQVSFSATDYGAAITSIKVPSSSGVRDDVLLGTSTLDGLVSCNAWFGALVGRFANRIGGARFVLDGHEYRLEATEGPNCLHSGYPKFCKLMWDAEPVETASGTGIRFTRVSPDGEQGFPGTVRFEVFYLLNERNELTLRYRADTDKDTPLNLTNHAYFNLAGAGRRNILAHTAEIKSEAVLDVDEWTVPTGRIIPVEGTPFDFNTAAEIGERINDQWLSKTNGFDHCYCLDNKGKLKQFAVFSDPFSGRKMTCSTNQPGVQFYTGNFLEGIPGRDGGVYGRYDGFCVETQQYPDAPNKKDFPSSILHAGDTYDAVTVFGFSW